MKNKLSIALLSRWVIAPLLLAGLIVFAAQPAYSANPETALAFKQAAPAKAANNANADVQELKGRIKELEEATRQNYALELDRGRKQVDWWLSFLAVLTAIMAIFGGLFPFLMARKDREIIKQDMRAIEQDKAQVRAWLDEIEKLKQKANTDTEAIGEMREFVSGTPVSTSEKVQRTAKETAEDETADPLLRLRAKAVEVSRPENAHEAYALWTALSDLDAQDANAQFNAGYWAHELGGQAQSDEKLRWLRLAGKYYSSALSIKPDMHEAAYNWGSALAAEARALSDRKSVV